MGDNWTEVDRRGEGEGALYELEVGCELDRVRLSLGLEVRG